MHTPLTTSHLAAKLYDSEHQREQAKKELEAEREQAKKKLEAEREQAKKELEAEREQAKEELEAERQRAEAVQKKLELEVERRHSDSTGETLHPIAARLKEKHNDLYPILQITVHSCGKWSSEDIGKNRGRLITEEDRRSIGIPQGIKDLETKLERHRLLQVRLRQFITTAMSNVSIIQAQPPANNPHLDSTKAYLGKHFHDVYEISLSPTSDDGIEDIELLTFANMGHRFTNECSRVAEDRSSSLKSAVFVYNFILQPCFRQELRGHGLEYQQ